ncbi:hypothetical protein Tco_0555840 [Tanacetum coccineum]
MYGSSPGGRLTELMVDPDEDAIAVSRVEERVVSDSPKKDRRGEDLFAPSVVPTFLEVKALWIYHCPMELQIPATAERYNILTLNANLLAAKTELSIRPATGIYSRDTDVSVPSHPD